MIAIDWGTTSFRAYRLDGAGAIVDSRVGSQRHFAGSRLFRKRWKS